MNRIASLPWLGFLALCGCVNVPVSDQLISYRDAQIFRTENAVCTNRIPALPNTSRPAGALDPTGFDLMSWNVHKGQAGHWPQEFAQLSATLDIVLLQEAHLTPPFRSALEQAGYQWSMARAFDFLGAETGVLTASRTAASGACLDREVEPLLRTPKSVLMTRYPVEGSSADLVLVNLHGINLTLGTRRFSEQLGKVADVLQSHRGPLVLAGDFNNWSKRRSEILHRITRGMALKPVSLSRDTRSRHWGRPVDQIFYRGLEVLEADSVRISSSDHNPLLVTFSVSGHSREKTE